MADVVIRNGRVVTPSGLIHGGIAIEGERITYVGGNGDLPQGKRVIDAEDNFVLPGLIDPHVHLGVGSDPETLADNFRRETEGAIHGGVTTLGHLVVARKGQSILPLLEETLGVGTQSSRVDFFCHALVADEGHLQEQPTLAKSGVVSFKHFFNNNKGRDEERGGIPACEEGIFFRSLEFIAQHGYPALGMAHCEEADIIYIMRDRLREAGRRDLAAWTESRPRWGEYKRMWDAFTIAKATGAPFYCVHISIAEGADLVAKAHRQGYRFYGETGPQWLTHTADMEEEIGCWGKVNTPLRSQQDNDRLWRGILDGGITCIGTDHCVFTLEAKEGGGGKHNNIWDSRPGLCAGMEHMLPVMMTYGVHTGRISIEDLVRVCATNTARVFGLYPRKGVLAPGADADIVLVDAGKGATIDKDFYHCRGDFSVYLGWKIKGMARTVLLRGKVVMEDYETVGKPGQGCFIPRGMLKG